MNKQRTLIAALISPLVSVLLIYIFSLVSEDSQWNYMIIGSALITSYLGLLILGYPLVYLLRRADFLTLPGLVLSGTALGVLVWYIFWLILGVLLESSAPFGLRSVLWGALFGFSISLCFGLIAGITNHSSR